LHQAVHHFHHVQAGAQRAVNRAHFQANDAGFIFVAPRT
jgi:hypothetical protein